MTHESVSDQSDSSAIEAYEEDVSAKNPQKDEAAWFS
jgi:hypothetical protein